MNSVENSTLCYLTKNNVKRLQPHIDYDKFYSLEEIYKIPIFFFSKKEEKVILGFKEFLMNPKQFISKYYRPVDITDRYVYMYEGGKPAYHANPDCDRIKSDFSNIKIPDKLRKEGKEEVIRFRKWYNKKVGELGKIDIKNDAVFRQQLYMEFAITYDELQEISYENSGTENFDNLSLSELEKRIDILIKESKFHFVQSTPQEKEIIKRFQKNTSLGYMKDEIQNNDTGLTDDALKAFLRSYDVKFKQPVKSLLLEYYRVQHNPQLRFEGDLLLQLNFKPCGSCYQSTVALDDLF